MNLPDPKQLQDAEWQVDHATRKLAPLIRQLQAATETEPTDPAHRPAYELSCRLLRALEGFFQANAYLVELLNQRETEMNEEMAAARFRYNQMGLDRDFYKAECQTLSTRYYAENDLISDLLQRLTKPANA